MLAALLVAGCADDTQPGSVEAPTAPPPAPAGTGATQSPVLTDAGTRPTAPTTPTPDAGRPDTGVAAPSGTKPDAGSGSPDDADSGGPAQPDTGHGRGGATESPGKLTAYIEMEAVPSGAEAHRCVTVELPNTKPVWVSTLHATLTQGSHHLIVDRRLPGDAVLTDAELCGPTMGADNSRLLIAQQHDTVLKLPENVGYLLEPKQRIFLQLHYFNLTAKAETIRGEIELELFATDAKPIEAQSIFTGSTSINLLPHQAGESKSFQLIPAQPAWNVFALTSHTHQLGVHATIERVASADAPATTPLHESRDWAEPPLNVFDQPLLFDGSDGLRLTCRYMNTTDRTVTFGTEVDDEMCFMWLYYFVKP